MPAGRPPIPFDGALAEFICERLATTDLGLEQILDERRQAKKSCVSSTTIWRWREEFEDFRNQFARARLMQAELLHDKAQEVASKALIGKIDTVKETKDGTFAESRVSDNVERSKLIVQTLLKRAGQLDSKKYGDKLDLNHGGEVAIKRVVADL